MPKASNARKLKALSPLGERVARTGVFSSRGGLGEGVGLEPEFE
jgi:hypothetical protein